MLGIESKITLSLSELEEKRGQQARGWSALLMMHFSIYSTSLLVRECVEDVCSNRRERMVGEALFDLPRENGLSGFTYFHWSASRLLPTVKIVVHGEQFRLFVYLLAAGDQPRSGVVSSTGILSSLPIC